MRPACYFGMMTEVGSSFGSLKLVMFEVLLLSFGISTRLLGGFKACGGACSSGSNKLLEKNAAPQDGSGELTLEEINNAPEETQQQLKAGDLDWTREAECGSCVFLLLQLACRPSGIDKTHTYITRCVADGRSRDQNFVCVGLKI